MLPKNLHLHLFIWFWIILSFIFLSAFLILRAAGYVINLKAKTIEKTGLVVVSSDPKGALLYLNGKFKEKTPAKLTYLRPGLYHLLIEKEGYKSWEKTEKVEPDKFLKEEAMLFLEKPEIKAATASEPEQKEIILDEELQKEIPKEAQDLSFDKNKKILLYRTDSEIWLYFLDKPKKEKRKIVARFSKNLKRVAFYPDFEHILFIIGEELRIIETTGTNDTKLFSISSSDFWVSSSHLKEIFFKEGDKVFVAKVR